MKWFKSLPPKQAAVLALIIANLIWGAASPIFKWALEDIPLFVLAYLRFFGATLLMLPLVYKRDLRIPKPDIIPILGIAFFGITLNITFFFLGLKNTPSINAPIIASSGPIFLILFSILLLHERPKRKTIIGTLISLLGVFIIIGRPLLEEGFSWTTIIGNLFLVIATLGAVAHTIFSKEMLKRISPIVISFWSFSLGSLSFLPMFVYQSFQTNWLRSLHTPGIVGLVFGIVLSSFLAYLLYEWGVERIDASETGVFTYIDPVVATVIAIPLLGETITPLFILGSFFVFSGIFVAEGRIHYHPFHKLKPH